MRYFLIAAVALTGLALITACGPESNDTPEVTIVLPGDGDTLPRGSITVKAVATDDNSVTVVEFYVNDTVQFYAYDQVADTFTFVWNAATATPGAVYRVEARAFDYEAQFDEDVISVTLALANLPAGAHSRDFRSRPGCYVVRLTANGLSACARMTVLD